MEQTECSETSAYKIHTPGNYLEESTKPSEHGERFKSIKQLQCLTKPYLHSQHSITAHEDGIESENWSMVRKFTVLNSKRNIRPH